MPRAVDARLDRLGVGGHPDRAARRARTSARVASLGTDRRRPAWPPSASPTAEVGRAGPCPACRGACSSRRTSPGSSNVCTYDCPGCRFPLPNATCPSSGVTLWWLRPSLTHRTVVPVVDVEARRREHVVADVDGHDRVARRARRAAARHRRDDGSPARHQQCDARPRPRGRVAPTLIASVARCRRAFGLGCRRRCRTSAAGASNGAGQLDQRAHAEAGAALRRGSRRRRSRERGPGDVEVHPRHAVDELLQEQPGGERAAVAAGRCSSCRRPPTRAACGTRRAAGAATPARRRGRRRRAPASTHASSLPMSPAILSPSATMHAPVSVARSIDRGRLVLRRERERVGQDEPTLGVGVEHLDGLAVADLQHVAGPDRGAARHVLDQRHVAGDARLHAERRPASTSRRSPPRHPTCRSSSSPCRRRS